MNFATKISIWLHELPAVVYIVKFGKGGGMIRGFWSVMRTASGSLVPTAVTWSALTSSPPMSLLFLPSFSNYMYPSTFFNPFSLLGLSFVYVCVLERIVMRGLGRRKQRKRKTFWKKKYSAECIALNVFDKVIRCMHTINLFVLSLLSGYCCINQKVLVSGSLALFLQKFQS